MTEIFRSNEEWLRFSSTFTMCQGHIKKVILLHKEGLVKFHSHRTVHGVYTRECKGVFTEDHKGVLEDINMQRSV